MLLEAWIIAALPLAADTEASVQLKLAQSVNELLFVGIGLWGESYLKTATAFASASAASASARKSTLLVIHKLLQPLRPCNFNILVEMSFTRCFATLNPA